MNAPPTKPPIRLGDLLIERGLITQDQLRIALQQQKASGKQLGEALLQLGFVTEDAMRAALADKLGEEAISLKGIVADSKAIALIPKALAKRHTVFRSAWMSNATNCSSPAPTPMTSSRPTRFTLC